MCWRICSGMRASRRCVRLSVTSDVVVSNDCRETSLWSTMCVCVCFLCYRVCVWQVFSFLSNEWCFTREKKSYIACSVLLLVPAQFRWNKYGPKKEKKKESWLYFFFSWLPLQRLSSKRYKIHITSPNTTNKFRKTTLCSVDIVSSIDKERERERAHETSPNPNQIQMTNCNPSLVVVISTYINYFILIIFGYVRDFFRRWVPDVRLRHNRKKGFPSLLRDQDDFYSRRLYSRVSDCFTRPISSRPGGRISVILRESNDFNKTFT